MKNDIKGILVSSMASIEKTAVAKKVQFGKYKGKPYSEAFADVQYCNWILKTYRESPNESENSDLLDDFVIEYKKYLKKKDSVVRTTPPETSREVAKEVPIEAVREVPREVPSEARETAREVPKEVSKEAPPPDLPKDLFKAIFVDHRNVFLKGPGGTGKSFLLKRIFEYCVSQAIPAGLTATTGVSAVGLGGQTIHMWSGIKTGEDRLIDLANSIRSNRDTKTRWQTTKILIIDEISMLGANKFVKLDCLGKYFRRNKEPFGNIQVIVSGDFLQLPPVNDEHTFNCKEWEKMDFFIFEMGNPYRYSDRDFYEILLRIRKGVQTSEDILRLKERVEITRKKDFSGEKIQPTRMYSLRKDVDSENNRELDKLPGVAYDYIAKDEITPTRKKKYRGRVQTVSASVKKEFLKILKNAAPDILHLKIGAQVMLTKNLAVESGLCNGSRGVVVTLNDEEAVVLFRNGLTIPIRYENWDMSNDSYHAVRHQIPLILAWATTIHKSQGSTLDYVVTSTRSIFDYGQAYVMFSRVRTLEGLFILEFDPNKIKADPKCLEYEDS